LRNFPGIREVRRHPMFFVLVAMPAIARGIVALSDFKTRRRSKKAWDKETQEVDDRVGDIKKRRVIEFNVMLTKQELNAVENSPFGKFISDREISQEAMQHRRQP
jgi:hypothetical protein